jgi:hypothetical protein
VTGASPASTWQDSVEGGDCGNAFIDVEVRRPGALGSVIG